MGGLTGLQMEHPPLNHFWSVDGCECLFCTVTRTPEQVAEWRAAGSPEEKCEKAWL